MKKTQYPITRHRSPLSSARQLVKPTRAGDMPRNMEYMTSLQKQLAADPLLSKYIQSREDEIQQEKRVVQHTELGDKLERPYIKKYLKKLQEREAADKGRRDEDLNRRDYEYPHFNQQFRQVQSDIKNLSKNSELDRESSLDSQKDSPKREFETFGYRDFSPSQIRNEDSLNRSENEHSEAYYLLLRQTRENLKMKLENIRNKSPIRSNESKYVNKSELEKKFEDRINEVMEKTWSSLNQKPENRTHREFEFLDGQESPAFLASGDEDSQPILSSPIPSPKKPAPSSTPLTRKQSIKEIPQRSDSSSRILKVQSTVSSISISNPAPQRRKTPPKQFRPSSNLRSQKITPTLSVSSPEDYIEQAYTEGDQNYTPRSSLTSRPFTPTSSRPRSSRSSRPPSLQPRIIQQPVQIIQPVPAIPQPVYCMPYYQPVYPIMAPPVNMYYNPYMQPYNYVPNMYSPHQNMNFQGYTDQQHLTQTVENNYLRESSVGQAQFSSSGPRTPRKMNSSEISKSGNLNLKTSPELNESSMMSSQIDVNTSYLSHRSKSPDRPSPKKREPFHNRKDSESSARKQYAKCKIDRESYSNSKQQEEEDQESNSPPPKHEKSIETEIVQIEKRKPVLIEIGFSGDISEAFKKKHADILARKPDRPPVKPKRTKSKAELLEIRKEMLKAPKFHDKSPDFGRQSPDLIVIEHKSTKDPPCGLLDRLSKGIKPKVSKKEMYEITNKKYKQLPEVLKRQEEDAKREELQRRLDKKREYLKQQQLSRKQYRR
jgi:hypothetical protein